MTSEITEYSKTEAALNELKDRWANVPDAETDEGYTQIKTGISEVRGFRTGLEKMRVTLKAPILERGKLLDSEAKRITAELVAIEQPMAAAKKVVDDREAREKAERIARLQAKIDEILAIPYKIRGVDSGIIAEEIEKLESIDATIDFFDLTRDAVDARRETLNELQAMFADRVGFETEQARLKAEAEKQAVQRAEIEAAQAEVEAARKILADQEAVREAEAAREAQAQRDIEAAEQLKLQAERDAKMAAELAEKRATEAVEQERAKVEAERMAEEESAKKREANKRHRTKINNEAKDALIKLSASDSFAEKIIKAIASNKIPNVTIKY